MSKTELYPLEFTPLFKYRIWGGEKLKTELNKTYSEDSIGESWELSDVPGDQTIVSNGEHRGKTLQELINSHGAELMGHSVLDKFGNSFPLLIKFIDAKTPLSIQVHPHDDIAKEKHQSHGKNEMWYVMDAEEGAELILGFENTTSKQDYKMSLENNSLEELLHKEIIQKGGAYYIPTGRVHAIGAGVLLAEIQQTSDVTYRIYDYDRVDATTGKKRELHNHLAVDVIDFEAKETYQSTYTTKLNSAEKLIHTPFFKTDIIELKGSQEFNYTQLDSFVILICVEGNATLEYNQKEYNLALGKTILIPASLSSITLNSPSAKILQVSI